LKFRDRLFYIALSVLLPPMGILLLAMADIINSQRNIETFARMYVEHVTENTVRQLSGGTLGLNTSIYDDHEIGAYSDIGYLMAFRRFPTHFAVLTDAGDFIYGSERLRKVVEENGAQIPIGYAGEMTSGNERFTIAKYPSWDGTFWLAGAISWMDMAGRTAASLFFWPFLIVLASLWGVFSVTNLWHAVVWPIEHMEEEVSSLRWGLEELDGNLPGPAAPQVRRMYETLVRVSRDAQKTIKANRRYMNDLVSAQEDERTKISRDIHDGPLQDVTALIQRIRLARAAGISAEDAEMELELAEKIAIVTVKEMRSLCDFLNPPWLELGLSQSLTELTERQSRQYGVKIFLGIDETLDPPDAVTLAFFRVVQEAVTNAVRHGEAKKIWIDIKKNDDGGIELTVQDDGHGFEMKEGDTADLRVEGHRGLSNMQERMRLIGGRLKIISYKGEGSCVRGLLP
jgi:signal transduction histidine kinase